MIGFPDNDSQESRMESDMPEFMTEAAYYMRRAKEESRRALRAEQPEIANAHHGLAIEYSRLARSAFPQLKQEE
jgi:hypothetical protein